MPKDSSLLSRCSGITTPGWRLIEIRPISRDEYVSETRPHEREETISDEAYVLRHRLIELRERHSLLVYELRRERNKKRLMRRKNGQRGVDHLTATTDEEEEFMLLDENASIQELEEAVARLEQHICCFTNFIPSCRKRYSSSSSSSVSSVVSHDGSMTADGLLSSPHQPQVHSRRSPLQLLTSTQARQIKNLNSTKLNECSLFQRDLLELAEKTTKKIKLETRERAAIPSSSTTASYLVLFKLSSPQFKQIENIEKSTIEISLSQGKILRTTKQAMDKPPIDLLRTSYCTFYRRIN